VIDVNAAAAAILVVLVVVLAGFARAMFKH